MGIGLSKYLHIVNCKKIFNLLIDIFKIFESFE